MEASDQVVGKLLDKADCICEQSRLAMVEVDDSCERIKGGEQLVFYKCVATSQRIEKRGFPGVGISYQGNTKHMGAACTFNFAAFFDGLQRTG